MPSPTFRADHHPEATLVDRLSLSTLGSFFPRSFHIYLFLLPVPGIDTGWNWILLLRARTLHNKKDCNEDEDGAARLLLDEPRHFDVFYPISVLLLRPEKTGRERGDAERNGRNDVPLESPPFIASKAMHISFFYSHFFRR